MASPQSGRLTLTPRTLAVSPYSGSGRVVKTPLSDEAIWKRLKEAGFDEESIKRRDKAALIAYIAKIEAELYDHQHHMGLLILEKQEWTSKYDEIKAAAESAELLYKREKSARASDLVEAKKREDSLKKALGIERECVANIEKALREMRAEYAEAKVAAENKSAEARKMMEDAQIKFTESEAKLRAAESLEAEAARYHLTAERKLNEIEAREDDLRRRMTSFKSDCDAKEKEFDLERQSISERQKSLQQAHERALDGQALLNQREEYLFNRSQELNKLEKELETLRSNLEDELKALNEEKISMELKAASLSVREEDVIKKENELNKKEEGLLVQQEKLASRKFDKVQQVTTDQEAIMQRQQSSFEVDLEMKRKLVEEELEIKRRAWELKEMDLKQREDFILEKEHDLQSQSRALAEKEEELEEKLRATGAKERSLVVASEEIELKKNLLQKEKEEITRMKHDLDKSLNLLEVKNKEISHTERTVEAMRSETNELIDIELRLKEEIDAIRAQKSELEAQEDQLKAEKAKVEADWEMIDEKRGELEKEAARLAEERLAISKFLKDERDSLSCKKDAMREEYKRDLEALTRDREAFLREMEKERSELFSKIQKERADFLLDIEMQKKELENCIENRREEIESYLKEREKALEEEKKKELELIASLKETVAKDMEHVNLEMKKLEDERREINLDRERREREWTEINDSIEEMKLQRQKLEKQRELLHADREQILAQIEDLKKLEDSKDIPDRIALPVLQRSNEQFNKRKFSVRRLSKQKIGLDSGQKGLVDNGIGHDLPNGKGPHIPTSPLSAPFSWLKRCADTLLEQRQNNKKRKQEMDVATQLEEIQRPSLSESKADTPLVEHAATSLDRMLVGTEETSMYVDKIITIQEVRSVDVSTNFASNQGSDEKLENNGGIKLDSNGGSEQKT